MERKNVEKVNAEKNGCREKWMQRKMDAEKNGCGEWI